MNELAGDTVSLIKSGQSVTSVSSAVKELLENSLDAGSDIVEIRLENYGLANISVKDNGTGVVKENLLLMAKPNFTSKITSFGDLSTLTTYGFRGEALHSLSSISDLTIVSKTAGDLVATSVNFDAKGNPKSVVSVAGNVGTYVTCTNLFYNLPVRRNYLQKGSRGKEELRKVETLLTSFALIRTSVRLSLYHNAKQIFSKPSTSCPEQNFSSIFGSGTVESLKHIKSGPTKKKYRYDLWIPKQSSSNDQEVRKTFFFVNGRPVLDKKVERIFKTRIKASSSQFGLAILALELPPGEVDVNLDPSKSLAFFSNQAEILQDVEDEIVNHERENFSHPHEKDPHHHQQQQKRGEICNERLEDKIGGDDFFECNRTGVLLAEAAPARSWARGNLLEREFPRENGRECLISPYRILHPSVSKVSNGDKEILDPKSGRVGASEDDDCDVSRQVGKRASFQVQPLQAGDCENFKENLLAQTPAGGKRGSQVWPRQLLEQSTSKHVFNKDANDSTTPGRAVGLELQVVDPQHGKGSSVGPENQQSFLSSQQPMTQSTIDKSFKLVHGSSVRKPLEDSLNLNEQPVAKRKRMVNLEVRENVPDKQKVGEGIGNRTLDRLAAAHQVFRNAIPTKFDVTKLKRDSNLKDKRLDSAFIGKIRPSGFWVCRVNDELRIVNCQRLQELVIFERLLKMYDFSTSKKSLAKPIDVSGTLSESHMNLLLSLDAGKDDSSGKLHVVDRRICSNGFCIEIGGDRTSAAIVATCGNINFVGWSELQEILQRISEDVKAPLEECRPLKMKNYLTGEAIRMQQQCPPNWTSVDEKLLQNESCLHGNPVQSRSICDLSKLFEIVGRG